MRHLLISVYWWSLCICIGCSDQPQQIPSKRTSDASTQAEHSSTTKKFAGKTDGETASHLNRADRELIAWFDSLGFPDLNKRKFVRIPLGEFRRLGDDGPKSQFIHAFLLEENDDDFVVFTLDLFTQTYARTSPDTRTEETFRFEELNLQVEAGRQLVRLREPGREDNAWRRFGEMVSERVEVFALARGCAANGMTQLAHDLITHAASMPDLQTGEAVRVDRLAAVLSNEIGHSMMWRNVLALGDPKIPRPQLLKRFQDFGKKFPKSRYAERAKTTANLLEQMVNEDTEHAKKELKPLGKMTTDERVAELIYQLRDQNGQQWSQPGSCDIFSDPRDGGLFGAALGEERDGGSPASQLVAIGYNAIPLLIEHLGDHRLTRSIGYHRNFYFSHHALRVGDCALAIIQRIAGQGFYGRNYTNAEMVKDGEAGDVKSRARKWWAEFQKKGEKQILVEGTVAGNESSPKQAERLISKYPDAALPALIQGIRSAGTNMTRVKLVQLAAGLKGKELVPALLEEMKSGPLLSGRVAAARGLLWKDHTAAVPAMIGEWQLLKTGQKHVDRELTPFFYGDKELIAFLATSNKLSAIQALAKDLRPRPIELRMGVVSVFGRSHTITSQSGDGIVRADDVGYQGSSLVPAMAVTELPKQLQQGVESLLVHALEDTEEYPNLSGTWNGKSFSDPRICDISGHILADHWKQKYEFDLEASPPIRDRQRVVMINIWRREHNLPVLPVPKPKVIPRVPDNQIKPLFNQLTKSASDRDRRKTLLKIESLGLPALPAVLEELQSLRQDDVARHELRQLGSRLASITSELKYTHDSATPSAKFRAKLEATKDKPTTSKALVALLIGIVVEPPNGVTGIKLSAGRFGDHTGVSWRITLTKSRIPSSGAQKGWDSVYRVEIGDESLHNSQGFTSFEYAKTPEAYGEVSKAIDKALASKPDLPFKIRISLIQDE